MNQVAYRYWPKMKFEAELRAALLRSVNGHIDEMNQAVDRLVCEDVDLERIVSYRVPSSDDLETGLMVDGKRAYVSTVRYEERDGTPTVVHTGGWIGEWIHLNPGSSPDPSTAE